MCSLDCYSLKRASFNLNSGYDFNSKNHNCEHINKNVNWSAESELRSLL